MDIYSKYTWFVPLKKYIAVPERFVRTVKNKIYKQMTSISKNVYIDKLADIVSK